MTRKDKEREIENALSIPDNVWGFFEWTTGSLRINLSFEDFKEDNLDPFEEATLKETLDHEMFHCYQILTTGYLYHLSGRILADILELTREYVLEVLKDKTSTSTFFKVLTEELIVSSNFQRFYEELDLLNPHGISSRDIVEGSAYLFQKRNKKKDLNEQEFEKQLKYSPSPDYSRTYRYARQVIEDFTLKKFQVISYISLLFLRPHEVFPKLCKGFNGVDISSEKIKRLIEPMLENERYLGTSWEFTKKYMKGNVNPVYADSLHQITEIANSNYAGNFYELMSSVIEWHDDNYKKINRPLIFNSGIAVEFENIRLDNSKTDKKLLLIIAGLSLLVNKNENIGPNFLNLRTS